MAHNKFEKENLFQNLNLIPSQKDICTYSHAFHIKINSFKNTNNLQSSIRVDNKVDTQIYQNKKSLLQVEVPILEIFRRNINISAKVIHYSNLNNLRTNLYWESTIIRHIKDNVKNICEELFLATILGTYLKSIIK